MVVESNVAVEHSFEPWPLFDIAVSAASFPFSYSVEEVLDLGALLNRGYPDPDRRLLTRAKGFVRGPTTDTLSLLKDINTAIFAWIAYESRDAEGQQPPLVTLDRGFGSCRDIALLPIEAVRAWVSARGRPTDPACKTSFPGCRKNRQPGKLVSVGRWPRMRGR